MSDVGFIPTTRQVREAYEVAHEEVGVPCDITGFDRWLNDIIRRAKAEALEAARGPYRCCLHCADDIIHDVEKDDHTVPCQLCQNDVIRRAKAEALREAANDIERRINEPNLILLADKYGGFHAGERHRAQREVDLLRARADCIYEIEDPDHD